MTIAEMHLAFALGYDSVATQGYPGFEVEEVDFFLNRAIERFVKTRYSGMNVLHQSFEDTQKRIEDLRTLVTNNTLSSGSIIPGTAHPNSFEYTLPDGTTDPKYYLMVSGMALIDRDECGVSVAGRRVIIYQITHDEYSTYLDDPFHRPSYDRVLILFEGNKIIFITDGSYNVTGFYMSYLRYATKVDLAGVVNCDLPEHTHQEIVDLAVRLCVAAVSNTERVQIETGQSLDQE
jgi:hypothetical protein